VKKTAPRAAMPVASANCWVVVSTPDAAPAWAGLLFDETA
jgi:hypothetical protein